MASKTGGHDRAESQTKRQGDDLGEQKSALDLGEPDFGWMPKDKIRALVKKIDASLKQDSTGRTDADL